MNDILETLAFIDTLGQNELVQVGEGGVTAGEVRGHVDVKADTEPEPMCFGSVRLG